MPARHEAWTKGHQTLHRIYQRVYMVIVATLETLTPGVRLRVLMTTDDPQRSRWPGQVARAHCGRSIEPGATADQSQTTPVSLGSEGAWK